MKALIILAVGALLATVLFAISTISDLEIRGFCIGFLSMALSYLLIDYVDFDSNHELDERHDFD